MDTPNRLDLTQAAPASLMRRLGALLYDSLLVVGLLLFATTIITVPVDVIWGAETASELPKSGFFTLFLSLVLPLFFIRFWLRGGQTLGMRTWRLMVVRQDGLPLTPKNALIRFLAAILSLLPAGLGLFWVVFDPEKLAWHDRLSATRLIVLEKK